jgi:ubiquinone/menaquinone biosynthesis C-methylase UbiE
MYRIPLREKCARVYGRAACLGKGTAMKYKDVGEILCASKKGNLNPAQQLAQRIRRNIIFYDGCDYSHDLTKIIGDEWKINSYYDQAEDSLHGFWGEDTVFYRAFQKLDLSSVTELACGHGRHVPRYLEKAGHITLVDINRENLDFCRNRFKGENKISYMLCQGNDFGDIPAVSQSAIFSYDAMVHFELLDVAAYLRDANRILMNGGRLLFHHSNAAFKPGVYYHEKPGWRNFMSAGIFTHLAVRMGFTVLEQTVIDWGVKDLDCVSLCEKQHTIQP